MSAAFQLPAIWGAGAQFPWKPAGIAREIPNPEKKLAEDPPAVERSVKLGFYRRRTESLLRRYLYASMQVGRSPSVLGDPVTRGSASSRPLRTFEDAVIFVLDVEACLSRMNSLDRLILGRIVLQEYTHAEAATLLGMSVRAIAHRFPRAVDRLTERLLEAGLLALAK